LEKLNTYIRHDSDEFRENRTRYLELVTDYRQRLVQVMEGGRDEAILRHRERGKWIARERIEMLVDKSTPFLELSPMAANGQYNDNFPSAGIVTGVGIIEGREAIIVANDATVKGGTYVRETIKKHLRAQEIAETNLLPCVYLVDSGGVFLPEQARVFPDRDDFGRIFYNQARMSAMGIPQISVVMGSCTAGGAYVPAMSDESIIVKEQGTIFIGGPPLVKAATGESVTAEELGGADVHTAISGVADHMAENDADAIRLTRDIFKTLPKTRKQRLDILPPVEPLHDIEDLYGLNLLDTRKPLDPREIIARVVDGSEFHEFKARYGTTLVTGFARVMGIPVGIVANNGVLFPESALKGAHFVELCCFRGIPLVFLQNISGFIVGKKYEHQGLPRDGAKFIHAVSNANVPKITFITGGSYGAGNYAMAGRAFDPRFLFMWPSARISVMGALQAAEVLSSVKMEQLRKSGKELLPSELQELKDSIMNSYERESSAFYSTSRVWDDGIIDPLDTRKVLGFTLSTCLNKPFGSPSAGIYRM
jgi:3-methylcrotonyl-CoA carboxylase beta subunit